MKVPRLFRARLSDHGEFLFRYRQIWPWLVLFLSLALVALFGILLMRYVERQDRQALELRSLELAAAIEQRMNTSEALLRAAGNAFSFVPNIDGDFFSSFVKGLRLNQQSLGMVGIGWTIPVSRDRIPELEARMRVEGRSDFFVWPVTDEKLNYTILFIEPDNIANHKAIGFNMFSDPARRLAMIQAFDMGKPMASGPISLKQESGIEELPGFLFYAPVFDAADREGAEAPPKTKFRGFVYAAFRGADLVKAVGGDRGADRFDLELYDVTDGARQILYDSHPEIWSAASKSSVSSSLSVGGRRWELIVAPIYVGEFQNIPQRIMIISLLGTGLLVSFLLTMMMWLTTRTIIASRQALDRQIEQLEIRSILLRELNHRVKNTLATVNSLAALSRQDATDVDSYYNAFNGRLRALSATHDLLTQSEWGNTELRDIVEAELAPFRGVNGRVLIEGPSVCFDPTKALSFGLSIHELATNASKYGALSSSEGRVSLLWHVAEDGRLHVRWTETGGPLVMEGRKPGFGSTLIEKLMARQLKAEVKLSFPSEGAVCEFIIPMDQPAAATGQPRRYGLGRPIKRSTGK